MIRPCSLRRSKRVPLRRLTLVTCLVWFSAFIATMKTLNLAISSSRTPVRAAKLLMRGEVCLLILLHALQISSRIPAQVIQMKVCQTTTFQCCCATSAVTALVQSAPSLRLVTTNRLTWLLCADRLSRWFAASCHSAVVSINLVRPRCVWVPRYVTTGLLAALYVHLRAAACAYICFITARVRQTTNRASLKTALVRNTVSSAALHSWLHWAK